MGVIELQKFKIPFNVYGPRDKYQGTVIGYSQNDSLSVGGGLFPNIPCVHFKSGAWLLVSDFLNNYKIACSINT